jgi:hypothetical protein
LHQHPLCHGRVQGVEQQIAGLGDHHLGQHQAQLLPGLIPALPIAGCSRACRSRRTYPAPIALGGLPRP